MKLPGAMAVAALVALVGCSQPAEDSADPSPTPSPTVASPSPGGADRSSRATVPEVVGLDAFVAIERIEDAGLGATAVEGSPAQRDSQIDTVEKVVPAAGSPVARGSTVEVYVYAFPQTPGSRAEVFVQVFEDNRLGLADAIESEFGPSDVESVDAFTYDPETTTIRLAVTSAYNGEDIRRDVAWALTRATATLYGPGGLAETTQIYPTFELSVGPGVSYTCEGEFMERLADRQITRDDWESTCR